MAVNTCFNRGMRASALCIALAGLAPVVATAQGRGGQQGPPPTPVRVDEVRMEQVQQRRMVTGDLRAARRALIASRESGIVVEYGLEEGQFVDAGQVVARLDRRRLVLQLDQLRANRAVAIATRDERQAQLEWDEADEELVRAAYESGASKQKEMQDAQATVRVSRARLHESERSIEAIDAQIASIEQRIEDTDIRSPFGGIVIATSTELGEWVGEGSPVVELLATDTVEAWLNVPQEHFAFLKRTNVPITVNVEATGATIEATSIRILPLIDDRARNFTAIVALDNQSGELAPGMSVIAWVPTDEKAERLTVSKSALMRDDTGAFAYVVRRMSPEAPPAVMPARFEILFPLADRFVIKTQALRPGDEVVVEGNERLYPTAPVSIVRQQQASKGAGQ